MSKLSYRADWNTSGDDVEYFYGTKEQCQSKARSISKSNDGGAYVVGFNGDTDIGCVFYDNGEVSYRDGGEI